MTLHDIADGLDKHAGFHQGPLLFSTDPRGMRIAGFLQEGRRISVSIIHQLKAKIASFVLA